jgi:hypothetical protein
MIKLVPDCHFFEPALIDLFGQLPIHILKILELPLVLLSDIFLGFFDFLFSLLDLELEVFDLNVPFDQSFLGSFLIAGQLLDLIFKLDLPLLILLLQLLDELHLGPELLLVHAHTAFQVVNDGQILLLRFGARFGR